VRTVRQRIADRLRDGAASPSDLSAELEVPVDGVLDELEHVARSLEGTDERIAVRPPRCRDCGFDAYDDLINIPSRCPTCRSERIAEPVFRVESRNPGS
jgi:predicted Zn-ribbon and HTH transcriptional regulator